VNSSDVWHESNLGPDNPDGDMAPVLAASVAEAIARHPSGKGIGMATLTAADRCDACGAAAAYRVGTDREQVGTEIVYRKVLDYCLHHWRKHYPKMSEQGWGIVSARPDINDIVEDGHA
jgi:hypothetical protein